MLHLQEVDGTKRQNRDILLKVRHLQHASDDARIDTEEGSGETCLSHGKISNQTI